MRPTCTECAIKHTAQASILLSESKLGYPLHKAYAMGHLAEAETELLAKYPQHAEMIREERKRIESDKTYSPNFNRLIERIKDECGGCELGCKTTIIEEDLYPRIEKHNISSDPRMKAETKDIGLVLGGVNLGWGIGYGVKAYVDPVYPKSVLGQDPSLLVDVGGTILGLVGALKLKKASYRKLAGLAAAGLSTHIWEDLAKMMPAAPVAMVPGYPATVAQPTNGQVAIKPQTVVTVQGKYR